MKQTYNHIIGYGTTNTKFSKIRNLVRDEIKALSPQITDLHNALVNKEALCNLVDDHAATVDELIGKMVTFVANNELLRLTLITASPDFRFMVRVTIPNRKSIIPTRVSDEHRIETGTKDGYSYFLLKDRKQWEN